MPEAIVMSRMPGSRYSTYVPSRPVSMAPPST